jgi:hypothetical protein
MLGEWVLLLAMIGSDVPPHVKNADPYLLCQQVHLGDNPY